MISAEDNLISQRLPVAPLKVASISDPLRKYRCPDITPCLIMRLRQQLQNLLTLVAGGTALMASILRNLLHPRLVLLRLLLVCLSHPEELD